MPSNPLSFNLTAGTAQVQAYGQKDAITQENTWAAGDQWSAQIASTAGNITLGIGNFQNINPTAIFTYRDRVYLALFTNFLFSDNGLETLPDGMTIDPNNPLGFEVQNSGAGVIPFTSNFGAEDTVQGFSQLQGRLAVFGRRSIQLWTTDADPNNFAWIQTLDNSGTQAPLSILNLGDYDCLYLDDSGVRSLRAKEVTSNAFIDDVGSAIDDIVQLLVTSGGLPTQACSVVEPTTKNYWISIPTGVANTATIYVLSRHPAVKQTAWSTYNASYRQVVAPPSQSYDNNGRIVYTGLVIGHTYGWVQAGTAIALTCGFTTLLASGTFVATATTATEQATPNTGVFTTLADLSGLNFIPSKFVVYKGIVYIFGSDASGFRVWQVGGPNGNLYDGVPCSWQLPWLDDKRPDLNKKAQGIQFIMAGQWQISVGMDSKSGLTSIVTQGSATNPNSLTDSTYDTGRIGVALAGTHFSASGLSGNIYGLTVPATFSALSFYYNHGEIK